MIWVKRDGKGDICYYTSDDKKFKKIKDATEYVASNYDLLLKNRTSYNILFERHRKINILLSKMINRQYN